MAAPTLTLAVLFYVTLDMSSPFVAGAFTFNPDECVEAVRCASAASQRAEGPALPARAPVVREDLTPSFARLLAWRPSAVLMWLADSGAVHRGSGDPPPSSSEDH